MVELSYLLLNRETSRMQKPSCCFNKLEWPAELNAFLKSRSTRMNLVSCSMACLRSQLSFWITSCTEQELLNPRWKYSSTAYFLRWSSKFASHNDVDELVESVAESNLSIVGQ